MPITDANIDLHSGGLGMDFVPSTTSHVLDDKAKQEETERLGMAFGAPYHVVIHEVDASYTFMSTCERKGVTAISSELGGVARVSIPGVECAAKGLRNALVHYGMMKGKVGEVANAARRRAEPRRLLLCAGRRGLQAVSCARCKNREGAAGRRDLLVRPAVPRADRFEDGCRGRTVVDARAGLRQRRRSGGGGRERGEGVMAHMSSWPSSASAEDPFGKTRGNGSSGRPRDACLPEDDNMRKHT